MLMRIVGSVVVICSVLATGCGTKVDLSTKEATIRTFHKAAVDGDKETAKKCFSKRVLDAIGDRFDDYFQEFQALANKTSVDDLLKKNMPKMVQEGSDWKIDEK